MKKHKHQYDLTNGSILSKLFLIAGPVMATQAFQMAYNLIDMFFVSRISSDAVAATGSAGLFILLSVVFIIIGSIGAEIGVSQNKGKGDMIAAQRFAHSSLFISLILGIFTTILSILLGESFIRLIGIQEDYIVRDAVIYLRIVGVAFPLLFMNRAITSIFNGSGNSRLPFQLKMIGLVVNIIVSPILIFSFSLGVMGAAIATTVGHIVTSILLLFAIKNPKTSPFDDFRFRGVLCPDKATVGQILKWSLPVSIEGGLINLSYILLMSMIASFGVNAVTTKQIGIQIESLSLFVAGGYGAALTSFVGQNYGANKIDRIKKGFKISLLLLSMWGTLTTLFLVFGGGASFGVFTDNPAIIESGIRYLRIVSFIQIANCMGAVCSGTFRGLGKTKPILVTAITFNVLRVPVAFLLSQTSLGLYGVFIGAALGVFMSGVVLFILYAIYSKKMFKLAASTE